MDPNIQEILKALTPEQRTQLEQAARNSLNNFQLFSPPPTVGSPSPSSSNMVPGIKMELSGDDDCRFAGEVTMNSLKQKAQQARDRLEMARLKQQIEADELERKRIDRELKQARKKGRMEKLRAIPAPEQEPAPAPLVQVEGINNPLLPVPAPMAQEHMEMVNPVEPAQSDQPLQQPMVEQPPLQPAATTASHASFKRYRNNHDPHLSEEERIRRREEMKPEVHAQAAEHQLMYGMKLEMDLAFQLGLQEPVLHEPDLQEPGLQEQDHYEPDLQEPGLQEPDLQEPDHHEAGEEEVVMEEVELEPRSGIVANPPITHAADALPARQLRSGKLRPEFVWGELNFWRKKRGGAKK